MGEPIDLNRVPSRLREAVGGVYSVLAGLGKAESGAGGGGQAGSYPNERSGIATCRRTTHTQRPSSPLTQLLPTHAEALLTPRQQPSACGPLAAFLPLALKKQNNRRHHRRRQETGRRQSPRASAPATQRSAASQEERKRPIESLPQPPTPAPHTQARGPSTPRANAHVAVAATHPTSPAGAVRWRSSLEGERSYLRPPLSRSSARGDPLPCGR